MTAIADQNSSLRTLAGALGPRVSPSLAQAPADRLPAGRPGRQPRSMLGRFACPFGVLVLVVMAAGWVLGAWWVLECVIQGESFGAVQLELYKGALTVTHCTDRTFLPIEISEGSPDANARVMRYWSTWPWNYRWGMRLPWGTTRATGVTGFVPSRSIRLGSLSPVPSALKPGRYTRLYLPVWFLMLGPLTPLVYFPVRRLRRRRAGHCQFCGYNLFGNISGRCPECGSPRTVGPTAAYSEESVSGRDGRLLRPPALAGAPPSRSTSRPHGVSGPVALCALILAIVSALSLLRAERSLLRRHAAPPVSLVDVSRRI